MLFRSASVPPLTTDSLTALIIPDEIAAGSPTRIWVEHLSNTTTTPFDAVPQIRIFTLDSAGTRVDVIPFTYMASAGEAYYYDWTPGASGTFLVTVAGDIATARVFATQTVTVRPRFDPVALATADVLVSRM